MCKGPGAVRNMATSNKLRKASVVESREVWRNGLWWVEKQASRLYAPLLSFIILTFTYMGIHCFGHLPSLPRCFVMLGMEPRATCM
jgi:hypothetical protein